MAQVPSGVKLVRVRDGDGDPKNHHDDYLLKINISHGPVQHEIHVPSQSTFGDMKKLIEEKTGVEPKRQKILFRGQEKEDGEYLHLAGVKDKSKVLLLEESMEEAKVQEDNTSSRAEVKESEEMLKALKDIADVRSEVDKLSERVATLGTVLNGGSQVADDEFVVVSELLMRQLLKLDTIEAEGDAKMQRRAEVRRIQSLHEMLDHLKARNSKSCSDNQNAVSMKTVWETFDSGPESTSPPPVQSSTRVTHDWERFD